MQESFLRIIRFFPRFRGAGFRTWIYLIVENTFCTMLKRDARTSAISIEEMGSNQLDDAAPPEDLLVTQVAVEEEISSIEVIKRFFAWLAKRNATHARIVEMDMCGFTVEEIADCMGVGEPAVRSVLWRAPRDYQKFLQKEKRKQRRDPPREK